MSVVNAQGFMNPFYIYISEQHTTTNSIGFFISQNISIAETGRPQLVCNWEVNSFPQAQNIGSNPYFTNVPYSCNGGTNAFVESMEYRNFKCGGSLIFSTPISVYTKARAPTNLLVASSTSSSVTLQWSYSFSPTANQKPIILHTVCAISPLDFICRNVSSTSQTVSLVNLLAARTYSIDVRSWNGGIYSDSSNKVYFSTIPAPSSISASVSLQNEVTISWSGVEMELIGYQICFIPSTIACILTSDSTISYSTSSLNFHTNYTVTVATVTSLGNSSTISTSFITALTSATIDGITSLKNQLQVSFTDSSPNSNYIDYFVCFQNASCTAGAYTVNTLLSNEEYNIYMMSKSRWNPLLTANSSIELGVTLPDPPASFRNTFATTDSLRFAWRYVRNQPTGYYRISAEACCGVTCTPYIPFNGTSFIVDDLSPNRFATCKIRSKTIAGVSETITLVFFTASLPPNVTQVFSNATAIKFGLDGRTANSRYVVCFDNFTNCQETISSNILITNLNPNSNYTFSVYIRNINGTYSSPNTISAYTSPLITSITATAINSTAISVDYSFIMGNIISMTHTLCKENSPKLCYTMNEKSSVIFDSLLPNRNYIFSVNISNGFSYFTATTSTYTFSEIPDVSVQVRYTRSVIVQWTFYNSNAASYSTVCLHPQNKCVQVPFAFVSSYEFTGLNSSSYYTASVSTTNSIGVISLPSKAFNCSTQPMSVSLQQIAGSSHTITVGWNEVNPNATINTWYDVCMLSDNSTGVCKSTTSSHNPSTIFSVQFDDLQVGQIYNFSVTTRNADGDSSVSTKTLSAITGLKAPKLNSIDNGADFATLSWNQQQIPAISSLQTIKYDLVVINTITNAVHIQTITSASNNLLLNLASETLFIYSITPIAYLQTGINITTSEQLIGNFTTLKGALPTGSPQIIEIIESGDNEVTIIVSGIATTETGNARILEYEIEHTLNATAFGLQEFAKEISTNIEIKKFTLDNAQGSVVIDNLSSSSTYYFRARGRNFVGYSPYSDSFIVTTPSQSIIGTNAAATAAVVVVILLIMICIFILICVILIGIIALVAFAVIKKPKQKYTTMSTADKMISEMSEIDSSFKLDYKDLSFENSSVLGSGAQGTVCTAKYKGALVAVKMFPKSVMGVESDMQDFLTELKFLSEHCRHINIIRLIGVAEDIATSTLCLVTELCSGGNLATFIEKNDISFEEKVSLLRGVASGMSYLHNSKVVHRDLKCENILLDASGTIPKIIDFGLSKQIENTNKTLNMTMNVGTSSYLAPEVIKLNVGPGVDTTNNGFAVGSLSGSLTNFGTPSSTSPLAMSASIPNTFSLNQSMTQQTQITEDEVKKKLQYDIKADVYSFAIIMHVVYFRNRNPYGTNVNELQLLYYVYQNPNFRPKVNEAMIKAEHKWYIDLMRQCWSSDPSNRPSFEQIIKIFDSHQLISQ